MSTIVDEVNEVVTELEFSVRSLMDLPQIPYRYYYMDSVPWIRDVMFPPTPEIETPGKHGNAEQFEKTIKYLEGMKDFDMHDWSTCIAGACLRANGYTFAGITHARLLDSNGMVVYNHPMNIAAELLGIPTRSMTQTQECHKIFCKCGWPTINDEAMFTDNAAGAIERLKYYQETGL